MLSQLVDTLVSPRASYEQKRSAWKQLRDSGKLDQAIGDLEQRMAADPRAAEYPAALGQAYLQKCGVIHDVREQGILAMQADKVFDTALNLDPANWEARYMKAVALSYWPASMNKSPEIIDHFQTLVQQQETQPPQPQFAETYVRLGDQYAKAGQTDQAQTTWERGLLLFPQNDQLKKKLTVPQ
jgi:tetratricopeptide (TPR) repeat protein